MRPIKTCFNRQLADICKQSIVMEDLSIQVKNLLPEELKEHCTVGNFDKGCLTLHVEEAAYATPLRYALPELRDVLRKEAGFYRLTSIKINVQELPKTAKSNPGKKAPILSEQARATIISESDVCAYQPLKQALIQLAQEPRKNDA